MYMKNKVKSVPGGNRGFTLVELMIGIAIFSIVLASAFAIFDSQQKSYIAQQGVVDIQENLRAGMYYLAREIRLAGYNRSKFSEGAKKAVGFVYAGPGMVRFTMDLYDGVDDDLDGVVDNDVDEIGFCDQAVSRPGEDIIYALAGDGATAGPIFPDGFPDTFTAGGTPTPVPAVLTRDDTFGPGPDTLVENVEAIAFAYAFDANNDGQIDFVDTDGDGTQDLNEPTIWAVDTNNDQQLDTILDTNTDGNIDINDAAGGAGFIPVVPIDRIRSVRMWMLVRSPRRDKTFLNQQTYVIGDKRLRVDDSYRRRLLTASVVCRNMGG